jgi:hypothetical protein
MKKRKADLAQLDLLEWAANRPTARILSVIPAIARRMWRERHQAPAASDGKLIALPGRDDQRKRA